jgi:hypothetical protein
MTTRREWVHRAIGVALLILMAETTWAAGPADAHEFRVAQQGQPPGPKLSPEDRRELREIRRERQQERFERADKDGDRALSKDEAAKVAPRLRDNFDNIDSNRDGRATPDEIRSFKRERAKTRRIERGGADPRF